MPIKVYYPVVLHQRGLEHDYTKKMFAICSLSLTFYEITKPTSKLEDIVRELNGKGDYALNFLSPFNELNLQGVRYTVQAFGVNDLNEFNGLRNVPTQT